MGYQIHCKACDKETWARNIIELIDEHTAQSGRLLCTECGAIDAYIYRKSELQETGEVWVRFIKGVIRIKTEYPTYSPYVFLTAASEDGEVCGIHFNYYKDTRPKGRLKHGHGPGGAPVLTPQELMYLLEQLGGVGIISPSKLEEVASRMRRRLAA